MYNTLEMPLTLTPTVPATSLASSHANNYFNYNSLLAREQPILNCVNLIFIITAYVKLRVFYKETIL